MPLNNISKILVPFFVLFFSFTYLEVNAIRESRPTAIDSRIRIMSYSANDVFKYTGYYGYQSCIELSKDEEVVSISMGDTTSWQIVPSGFRIFIKPMEQDATTNMTLITNKRTYFFELYAEEAEDIRDPDLVFNMKFVYPDEMDQDSMQYHSGQVSVDSSPDLAHPEKYNFNYSISGFEDISPIKIYDDGEFTYLQFRDKNAEIPAIFAVDENLHESMVNYRLSTTNPNLFIIEQVFPKLSIRLGTKVVCVFNEGFRPY